jgi:lipopolysaccharide/colanic/teichoic acid biosynthesis glycosyltransferase
MNAVAPRERRGRRRVIVALEPADRPLDPALVEEIVGEHSRFARAIKRGFDIVCAAFGLLATAPLMALMAAVIKLESRGPAFYRQPRMGRDQRPFTVVKLRTMDESGRVVTRLGRLLRPTGLDEIPQLWNVLKGEMSIVGPRPEVLDRVPRWEVEFPGYWARHLMRPGITGWAQVNGLRGHVPIGRRLQLDLRYLCCWRNTLDLLILARTFTAVWRDTRSAMTVDDAGIEPSPHGYVDPPVPMSDGS